MFLLVGPNTGLGHNSMVFMIESQIAYVLDAIRTMRATRRLKCVDVRRDVAGAATTSTLQARLAQTVWSAGGCKSWYTTRDGKNTTLWPGFTFEFRRRTRRFDPARLRPGPGRSDRNQGERRAEGRRERSERIRGVSQGGSHDELERPFRRLPASRATSPSGARSSSSSACRSGSGSAATPFQSHLCHALSLTFPGGERLFMELGAPLT